MVRTQKHLRFRYYHLMYSPGGFTNLPLCLHLNQWQVLLSKTELRSDSIALRRWSGWWEQGFPRKTWVLRELPDQTLLFISFGMYTGICKVWRYLVHFCSWRRNGPFVKRVLTAGGGKWIGKWEVPVYPGYHFSQGPKSMELTGAHWPGGLSYAFNTQNFRVFPLGWLHTLNEV